jgi:hypothetical protein
MGAPPPVAANSQAADSSFSRVRRPLTDRATLFARENFMDLSHAAAEIDRRRNSRKTNRKAEPTPLIAQERTRRIAEAAYFIAERRGFAPGAELADWLQAEARISTSN